VHGRLAARAPRLPPRTAAGPSRRHGSRPTPGSAGPAPFNIRGEALKSDQAWAASAPTVAWAAAVGLRRVATRRRQRRPDVLQGPPSAPSASSRRCGIADRDLSSTASTPTGAAVSSSPATARVLGTDENAAIDKGSVPTSIVVTRSTTRRAAELMRPPAPRSRRRNGPDLAAGRGPAPTGPAELRASHDKFDLAAPSRDRDGRRWTTEHLMVRLDMYETTTSTSSESAPS